MVVETKVANSVVQKEITVSDQERQLIQQVKIDPEAFGKLYEQNMESIYRHLYYRIGNHADTEDLVSQTFTKAFVAREGYDFMGKPFKHWLMVIAHNLLVDHYRAKKEIFYTSDLVTDLIGGEESDPEIAAERSIAYEKLQQAILKLNFQQRAVVVMRYLDGMEYEEIAAIVGKPEGAIRVVNSRALGRLKILLGGQSASPYDDGGKENNISNGLDYGDLASKLKMPIFQLQRTINQAEKEGQLQLQAKGGPSPRRRIFNEQDQKAILDYLNYTVLSN